MNYKKTTKKKKKNINKDVLGEGCNEKCDHRTPQNQKN